jgi:hypothetical protein
VYYINIVKPALKMYRQHRAVVQKIVAYAELLIQLTACRLSAVFTCDCTSSDRYVPFTGKALFERLALLYQHFAVTVENTDMYYKMITVFWEGLSSLNCFASELTFIIV